jgi:hypothetical protein
VGIHSNSVGVDRRGMDAHYHLSGLRVGLRGLFIDERLWTTTDM